MTRSEIEARKVAEQFVVGFNTRNEDMVRDALHFPQVRFASGGVFMIPKAEDWGRPFERLEKEGWHHSALDSVDAIHVSDEKVHLGVVFTRFRADGTSYATHRSLWIITKIDGHWGVQGRSSYAP